MRILFLILAVSSSVIFSKENSEESKQESIALAEKELNDLKLKQKDIVAACLSGENPDEAEANCKMYKQKIKETEEKLAILKNGILKKVILKNEEKETDDQTDNLDKNEALKGILKKVNDLKKDKKNVRFNEKVDVKLFNKEELPESLSNREKYPANDNTTTEETKLPIKEKTAVVTEPVKNPTAVVPEAIPIEKPATVPPKVIPKPATVPPKVIPKPAVTEAIPIEKPTAVSSEEIPVEKPTAVSSEEIPVENPTAVSSEEIPVEKPTAVSSEEIPKLAVPEAIKLPIDYNCTSATVYKTELDRLNKIICATIDGKTPYDVDMAYLNAANIFF